MKKILSLVLAGLMLLCIASCGKENKEMTDSEYVIDKGTLVVGITEFEPMDYQEGNEWVGFDADMARAFADSLGVKAEFALIEWDDKGFELDGKSIDCVWNGMTICDEVTSIMSVSDPYCNNQQVVIVKKDIADKIKSPEDCKDLKFAVEASSAGKDQAAANGFNYTEVLDQATALLEVKSGTSDAAIIDSLMAAAMVGEGTSYEDLTYTIGLNDEQYGVGFRKGSDLTAKLNDFFKKCLEDGTTEKIAEKYGVQAALIK